MKRDDIYFRHMLDTARRVRGKVAGVTKDQYDADENLRLALAHLLQIIGEAARCVSSEGEALCPDLPWRAIRGMRHRIVHDYMSVDEEVVWRTANTRMEELITALERVVGESP